MDETGEDLERRSGARTAHVSGKRGDTSLLRRLVGRPRIWVCVTWCVLGVVWVVLAVMEPAVWRFVLGAGYLVLGAVQLIVAIDDRRHGSGAYEGLRGRER